MRSLYELTDEWQYVFNMLEYEDIDEESVLDTCQSIEEEIAKKAENYGKVIRMLELEAQDARSEAARLAARAKVTEHRAEALRAQLCETMKATGQAKLRTPTFSFAIAPSPPSVRVTDLDAALNSGYIREPRMDESLLDKQAIKRDLEAGAEIPGVELVRGESLRMR